MADRDLQQLRQVLRDAVKASRMPARELERALGLGHGYLSRLLDGALEIKARYLVRFAELLRVPPGDFLALAYPEATSQAEHRLADYLSPKQAPARVQEAQRSGEDLAELVRAVLREEIAALKEESASPARDKPKRS